MGPSDGPGSVSREAEVDSRGVRAALLILRGILSVGPLARGPREAMTYTSPPPPRRLDTGQAFPHMNGGPQGARTPDLRRASASISLLIGAAGGQVVRFRARDSRPECHGVSAIATQRCAARLPGVGREVASLAAINPLRMRSRASGHLRLCRLECPIPAGGSADVSRSCPSVVTRTQLGCTVQVCERTRCRAGLSRHEP
jgi:hypothetical protein